MIWIYLAAGAALAAYAYYFTVHYVRLITNIFLNSTISAPPQTHWEIDGQVVKFLSLDGVGLKGIFVPCRSGETNGTIVFAHEVGAGLNSYERYCAFLLEEGYQIFSFDFRGQHAEENEHYNPTQWASENEYYDLLGAIAYVQGRDDVDPDHIGLFGVSRGATACLCVLGRPGGQGGRLRRRLLHDGDDGELHTPVGVDLFPPVAGDEAARMADQLPELSRTENVPAEAGPEASLAGVVAQEEHHRPRLRHTREEGPLHRILPRPVAL